MPAFQADNLNGVFLPLTTPFEQSGNLDLNNFTKNIQSSNKYDFKGIIIAPKSGESFYLTDEERVRLVQTAKQNIKAGRQLFAGAGHAGTRATIELANQLAGAGAQAVLVQPPRPYYERQTQEAWVQHFKQVADASKVPVIIYNIPAYTGADMDARTVTTLAAHQNIVGLSDASENPKKIREIVDATKDKNFRVWAGTAHLMTEYTQAGATGAMPCLANLLPTEILQTFQNATTGKQTEAQQTQTRFTSLSQMLKKTFGPVGLKYLLDKQAGQFYGGPARSPTLALTTEEKQTLDTQMQTATSA